MSSSNQSTTLFEAEADGINFSREKQMTGHPAAPDHPDVALAVNGGFRRLTVDPRVTLLDVLRDHLGLTGTKRVCDRGECGACTVLLDGRAVYACLLLAVTCEGRDVTTIEGVTPVEGLHPVQRALVEADALQCGFCTPGQVLSAVALLQEHPHPSPEQVTVAMSGNLCRCGAYPKIVRALRAMTSGVRGGTKGTRRRGKGKPRTTGHA